MTTIRILLPSDDRAVFASGDIDLDRFFTRYAGQNQFKHHIGTSYVALDDATGRILGFATVSPASIEDARAAGDEQHQWSSSPPRRTSTDA